MSNAQSAVKQGEVETGLRPDFGQGRYSPLMDEVYDDAQTIFQLSPQTSEKLAKAVARELGAILANQPVEVKLGKTNKDGKLTISEACKVKNVTMTYPIFALKALNYANEAGKNGFIRNSTSWVVSPSLTKYFTELDNAK